MTNPVFEKIQKDISENDIVLYMKGTKQIPQCGFSATVAQVLERVGISEYKDVNVLADAEIRDGIKEFSDWPTIPQLYVKGEFIGGCDIVREMYQSGELQELLREKGIAIAA
jgi:monothiol glutaredoxin